MKLKHLITDPADTRAPQEGASTSSPLSVCGLDPGPEVKFSLLLVFLGSTRPIKAWLKARLLTTQVCFGSR